ncbi:MAG: hypothetical protein JXX28_07115 [Deltaproteobacteria bacterium]|nr:hypothetical protein [Deltaproteobacteria bacterium]
MHILPSLFLALSGPATADELPTTDAPVELIAEDLDTEAAEVAPVLFPDRGAAVPNPYNYETNPTWTTPPIEGMRKLEVEPAAFIGSLSPACDGGEGQGNLVLVNQSSGWAYVDINGTRVGQMGPLARATVYGVAAGTYKVTYKLTSDYTWTAKVATCADCTAETWTAQ